MILYYDILFLRKYDPYRCYFLICKALKSDKVPTKLMLFNLDLFKAPIKVLVTVRL